jgi:hypothetical protein
VAEHRLLDDQRFRALAGTYLDVKRLVVDAGYGPEIDWQEEVQVSQLSERDFLRETAWVILCSGFSEQAVRARFGAMTAAFGDWRSARSIVTNRQSCRLKALSAFANAPKIDAIIHVAEYVDAVGFEVAHADCLADPIPFLSQFPYLGPATSRHLAKNLGFAVSKPDRHLMRVAAAVGYDDPQRLCQDLADGLDENVSVVDIVIWRHAVLWSDYEGLWERTLLGH